MTNITKEERFKLIPSVYALFVRDDKILLLRRYQTGYEDGNYGLVAGHADGGETMKEALIRESHEEAGVKINTDDLAHALTMHRWCGDHERMDFFFLVESWSGEIKNMELDKCDDLSWFPINELPTNTIPYIKEAINNYQQSQKYCEFGWNK